MTVTIEPWAEEHVVPPRHVLEITFEGGSASVATYERGQSIENYVYLEETFEEYRYVVRPARGELP